MSKLYVDEINSNNQNKLTLNDRIGIIDGTEQNPSIFFQNEPTSGIYRESNGNLGISILGSKKLSIDSNGFSYYVSMFRNLIVNGDMNIHQRGSSSLTRTTGDYLTADRWNYNITTSGTWDVTTENDAPTGTGLRKSLKTTCAVAKTSLGSGDALTIQQRLEGQNVQILKAGTSSAESITVSFWVKSNLTGTYNCELSTSIERFNSTSYTINLANVWEKKTITYSGDTVASLQNDNTYALRIMFWCVAGSSFTNDISRTSWNTSQGSRAVNQVNLASTIGNYFQVTGVQMEIGTVATSFEILPYEIQLQRCMRYFQKSFLPETPPSQNAGRATSMEIPSVVGASTIFTIPIYLPVVMRTALSSGVTIFNPSAANAQVRNTSLNTDCTLTSVSNTSGNKSFYVVTTTPASTVAGHTLIFHYTASAEL